MVGGAQGEGEVIAPAAGEATAPEVTLDFVGSLDNAAIVISRLHVGEKRLVFCDSRRQVEQLAVALGGHGVETYVSHSSLSQDERRRAEAAFAEARDCVIVATSTLELGIDVGDLDRMIQIDAPGSVASFLQRLGRTGRRNGRRNALFLATSSGAFLKTIGLLHLWRSGFVEPVEPPAFPIHVLAQQILALVLQEGGVPRSEMLRWLQPFLDATAIEPRKCDGLIDHLLANGVLFEADGLVSLGDDGERLYGRRNFLELFSVFMAPPLFSVLEGRAEVGLVDETSLIQPKDEPVYLTLAGRGWKVTHIDWSRRRVWVEAANAGGQARWSGSGPGLSWELARAVPDALINHQLHDVLSRRALEALEELQDEFDWVAPTGSVWVDAADGQAWWTFAGAEANAVLVSHLREMAPGRFTCDAWRIRPRHTAVQKHQAAIELLESATASGLSASLDDIETRYKFTDILSKQLQDDLAFQRGFWLSPTKAMMLRPLAHVRRE
nr:MULTISPECIES: helicase-related protein [unclassified Halorhodospira]